jgi:hypothetical protein
MDLNKMNSEERFALRKQKLILDIEGARRLQKQGIHTLDALDQLIHTTIELARVGFQQLHPIASEEDFLQYIRKQTTQFSNLKRRLKSG